jgi:hypothetical protein
VNKNSDGQGKKNTQNIRMGGVLGAIDLFNAEVEDSDMLLTYTAHIPSGTILKLKFHDFYQTKYGDESTDEEGIANLSPQDLTIRLVQRAGFQKLSENMNQFLRKCNLMPAIGSEVSVKYICEGNRGRTLEVSRKEQEVLFLLQGEMKIVLEKSIVKSLKEEKNRGLGDGGGESEDSDEEEVMRHEGGSIAMTRQGEPTMTVSMSQIPLAVLEPGSILLFDEDMFTSLSPSSQPPGGGRHHHHPTSSAHPSSNAPAHPSNSNLLSEHDENEPEEPVGLPSLPDPQQRKERDAGKNVVTYLNHMSIVFEKSSVYLSVPLKRIRNCLQAESYQTNLGRSISSPLPITSPCHSLSFQTSEGS